MENDVLQKKNPFPNTMGDMCHVLTGWKKYNNKPNWFSDANDGINFTT